MFVWRGRLYIMESGSKQSRFIDSDSHDVPRIPDGVVLSYPVLNMCRDAALPARVLSIRDPILAYAFLDKVMKVE